MLKPGFTKLSRYICLGLLFVSGSAYLVLMNFTNKKQFPWKNNLTLYFQYPWFLLTVVFVGRLFAFFPLAIMTRCKPDHTLSGPIKILEIMNHTFVPAFLEIISTALQNYGLIYMPQTIWSLFHGFQLLFITVFAIVFRHQQLFLVDWLGLFITVAGISASGCGALARGIYAHESNIANLFFAFIAVMLANAIRAYQTIVEEKLVHDLELHPLEVTTYEGLWGSFLLIFIILPILNITPNDIHVLIHEDTGDAFYMLGRSGVLITLLVFIALTSAVQCFTGLVVVSYSDAIHRVLYEMVFPLIVWIALTIGYYITKDTYVGQQLDKNSIIDIVGIVIAILGTFVYNRFIKFPCFTYVDREPSYDADLDQLALEIMPL